MFLKFQKCIKLSKWNILIEKCHVENEMLTDAFAITVSATVHSGNLKSSRNC